MSKTLQVLPVRHVNKWGDFQCPWCHTYIITPLGCIIKSGVTHCPLCKRQFLVSEEIAVQANTNADVYLHGGSNGVN